MADDKTKNNIPSMTWGFSRPPMSPPTDPFLSAKQAYQSGNLVLAEKQCQQILARQPGHLPAKALLGMIAGMTQRANLAIQLLTEVVSLDPTSWGSLNALSMMLRQEGQLDLALKYRLAANNLKRQDPHGFNELGLCYLDLRNFDLAEENFRRAIAGQPKQAPYHHNLARSLQLQGRIQEAIDAFRTTLELDPSSIITYSSLSKLFVSVNRIEEAIQCSKLAYEIDPNSAKGNVEMAHALLEQSKFAEAEPYLNRALEIDPEGPDANGMMATWLQQSGRFQEAEDRLKKVLETRPNWSSTYLLLASGRKAKDADRTFWTDLSEQFRKTPKAFDDPGEINYALGKAYDDLKEYETAIGHYHEANRLAYERQSKILPFRAEAHTLGTDRTIQTFTKEFFERHAGYGRPSDLPILIVGMMRSGTTLTEQILTSHPQIGPGGELSYWMNAGRDIHHNLTDQLDLSQVQRISKDYLRVLRDIVPESPRVTDKMPQNYMALGLIHTAFPNARIIHCRRNPIDNCLSIYFTHLRFSPDFAHKPENIVFVYREYQRLMAHWRSVLPPDRFIEVDYEAIVADREPIVRKLVDFVGLEWDDACLHHEENDRLVRTPSLWQARQPIYKTSSERWRNYEPWLGEFRSLLDENQQQIPKQD
jgi:tetratricopeptide (TPR) repeat protein